ncbi:hypothetical protein N7528_000152 [Penicillium herquei]|nr:hypothetical protein N7528_000152 [Penicillium herquei]
MVDPNPDPAGGPSRSSGFPTRNELELPAANEQPQLLTQPNPPSPTPETPSPKKRNRRGKRTPKANKTSQNQPAETMPPAQRRDILAKEHFAHAFGSAKTQTYQDPAVKGPGSHTIRTLAWNPAGSLIATGSADKTLRIWNPERAHVRYSTELRGHSAAVENVLFNPIRDAELASCSADGTVRIWDVRSKTCVSRLDVGGEAFTLSWSADGGTMLVGRKDDTLIPVSVQSPSTPTILSTEAGSSSVPDASIYTTLTARPQDVQTNATAFSWKIPTPESPNLRCFLTTGEGRVKIVDYPSFETLHTLNAHTAACISLALAPNGRYLAIGGGDTLISLWDTTEWMCLRTCSSENGGAIRGVSWSFDGRYVCGASDEPDCPSVGLEIFHAETGDSVYSVPTGPRATVPAVAWHPSRYWLAYSTTNDGPGGSNSGLKIVGPGSGNL